MRESLRDLNMTSHGSTQAGLAVLGPKVHTLSPRPIGVRNLKRVYPHHKTCLFFNTSILASRTDLRVSCRSTKWLKYSRFPRHEIEVIRTSDFSKTEPGTGVNVLVEKRPYSRARSRLGRILGTP